MNTICLCHSTSRSPVKQKTKHWSLRKQLPIISVTFEGMEIDALLDSGSMIPLLSESVYTKLAETTKPLFTEDTLLACGCNGSQLDIPGVVTGLFKFHKNETPFKCQFYVLRQATSACIIPSSWLDQLNAVLDYNCFVLTYDTPPSQALLTVQGELVSLKAEQLLTELDPIKPSDPLSTDHQLNQHMEPTDKEENDDEHQLSSIVIRENLPQVNSSQLRNIKGQSFKTFTLEPSPKWPQIVSLPQQSGFGIVKSNKLKTKQILTVYNTSNATVSIDINKPLPPAINPSRRTIPLTVSRRSEENPIVNVSEVTSPEQEKLCKQHQSKFDHRSRNLTNLPIDSKKSILLSPHRQQHIPSDQGLTH